jgi:hypothetical protein
MEVILGIFGLVLMFFACPMTVCLIFASKTIRQRLVVLSTYAVLFTATYYAFKFDDTGIAPFLGGLLWMIGGIVLSSWLEYRQVINQPSGSK